MSNVKSSAFAKTSAGKQKSNVSHRRIYMDHASTTPLDPRVLKAMLPYFGEKFGNPSSIHAEGVAAKKALGESRTKVARLLQAHADEVIFTSGGTESNNLAIFGIEASRLNLDANREIHIITTNIEHSSVLEPIRELERRGASVTYAPVEPNGIVNPKKIVAALRPETVLVSVQYANNEIGTIQPIPKIAREIRDFRNRQLKTNPLTLGSFGRTGNQQLTTVENRFPIFHTDASQAPLYLDCAAERLGVDLMTLDGHKMYGPKGASCLYVRRGTQLAPIIFGGGQERGLRSTTENVPSIVGFAKAFEIAAAEREKESTRLAKLRDYCHSNILQNVGMTKVIFNGDMKERLPNNVNISIFGLDAEFAVLKLDAAGISCSTKSSCLGSDGGSYVVRALGGGEARALSTLRFTFGRSTTKEDVDFLLAKLKFLVY